MTPPSGTKSRDARLHVEGGPTGPDPPCVSERRFSGGSDGHVYGPWQGLMLCSPWHACTLAAGHCLLCGLICARGELAEERLLGGLAQGWSAGSRAKPSNGQDRQVSERLGT
jgi:hypothetical protein